MCNIITSNKADQTKYLVSANPTRNPVGGSVGARGVATPTNAHAACYRARGGANASRVILNWLGYSVQNSIDTNTAHKATEY